MSGVLNQGSLVDLEISAESGRLGRHETRESAMALDIGDLDGKVKLFETAAAALEAQLPDLDAEDLDELVIDTLSEEASLAVNAGADYETAHGEAEAIASEINNGGPARQLAALLALGWTSEAIVERLADAEAPAL
jgi:hypothetical protein